jgi:hypothetical protein
LFRVGVVLVAEIGEVGFVNVEFWGHRDDLLNGANVAFKFADLLFGVEVPKGDGAVVGGGEEGPAWWIEPD